jgi:hypothetical protein
VFAAHQNLKMLAPLNPNDNTRCSELFVVVTRPRPFAMFATLWDWVTFESLVSGPHLFIIDETKQMYLKIIWQAYQETHAGTATRFLKHCLAHV